MILPPGFVAVPLKGAVLVIPERVYVAGLRLGKLLRRREASQRRVPNPPVDPTCML
jgi:hypothetical protein